MKYFFHITLAISAIATILLTPAAASIVIVAGAIIALDKYISYKTPQVLHNQDLTDLQDQVKELHKQTQAANLEITKLRMTSGFIPIGGYDEPKI